MSEDTPETADDPDVEDDGDDGDDAGDHVLTKSDLASPSASTKSRVFLALIAVFVVGVVIGRVTAPDGEGGDDGGEAVTATTGGGLPFPAGDQDRTGYWGLAGLQPVVGDAFDREDNPNGLGRSAAGSQWREIRGRWAIAERQAELDGGQGDDPALVVLEGAQGDGLVEVTMPVVEAGAGLVFRYLDPDNFWAVIADPEAGNWAIWKTIDGEATPVDTVEASTADGVTVTTIQTDRTLRILVDGEDVLLLEDGALSDRLQGGLLGPADGDGTARWDRFLVLSAPT